MFYSIGLSVKDSIIRMGLVLGFMLCMCVILYACIVFIFGDLRVKSGCLAKFMCLPCLGMDLEESCNG